MGIAQRGAGSALTVYVGSAFGAKGNVVRCAQVCAHPQLAVNERRDGLSRQMFGGAKLAWRTHRRITLRGELGGEPGERTAEHMSPFDHHQPLSVSALGHSETSSTTSNVARRRTRNTNEQPIRRRVLVGGAGG
jgi:hypothetical protein